MYIIIKILIFWKLNIVTITVLKMKQIVLTVQKMCPKDADGMINTADPDQTTPKAAVDQGQHYLFKSTCSSIYIFL